VEKDKCSNCGKPLSDCDYSCYYQEVGARGDWEKEARDIVKGYGLDDIDKECLVEDIVKLVKSAAFEKGREER
jgi:hypothetical protein